MLADLLDLVLPRDCAGCRRPGRLLCADCARALRRPRLHRPDPCPPGLPPLVAAADYGGAARAALLAHKEDGRLGLAAPLGAALAGAVRLLDLPPGVVLVPVPSAPQAVRERGHDHARRLARAAARRLPGSRVRPLLTEARTVADQACLDAAGRAANVAGALLARPAAAGLVVVVVDDVVTTGATLAESARALRAAGAHVVGAAVVAATVRRHPGRPRSACDGAGTGTTVLPGRPGIASARAPGGPPRAGEETPPSTSRPERGPAEQPELPHPAVPPQTPGGPAWTSSSKAATSRCPTTTGSTSPPSSPRPSAWTRG